MNEIGRIALCVDIIYFAFKELVNSITESIFPKLISFRVAGEKEKFRRLVGTNYRIVNIALGCILSLGLGLSSQFLGFLGGDFSVATYEFNLLLFSLFFNCWYLIHGQLLLIFNRSEVVITCQCAGLLVISLFYLFFHSTLMELCIGLLLASVVISALTYSVVSKLAVGEDTTIYFARLTFPICLVSLLLKLWSPHGLLQVGAAAIIAFIFYVSLVFLCRCLPETDIKFIRTTINNSWHR